MFAKFLVLLFIGILLCAVIAVPLWLVYMAAGIHYDYTHRDGKQ